MIGLKKIIELFEDGNVCVTGLRGRGKDMLMANVVARRNLPYVSNLDYTDDVIPFDPLAYDCGGNDYRNFVNCQIKRYIYPHTDKTDIYISDAGIYFPSQFCNELNRDYKFFPTFFALSRQLGECNVHINVQNLNRCWDKIREQSDIYIRCNWCKVIANYVIQVVTTYDNYDSCVQRVKPFNIRTPLLANSEIHLQIEMERERYEQRFGKVQRKLLIYKNISTYDTRKFKEMLENGSAS